MSRIPFAFAATALLALVACDNPRNGGLLCQNATNELEPCCVDQTGAYKACSVLGLDPAGGADTMGADGGPTGDTGSTGTPDSAAGDVGGPGPGADTTTTTPDASAPTDSGSSGPDIATEPEDTGVEDDSGGGCAVCEAGATKCKDSGSRLVCVADGACTGWQTEPCGEETTCSGGVCVSGGCAIESACEQPGVRSCNDGDVWECTETDVPGCAEWLLFETCGTGTTCDKGACVETFVCPAATKCTKAGSTKCSGQAIMVCKASPEDATCLQWTKTETCGDGVVCEEGHCIEQGLDCRDFINCVSTCEADVSCAEKCEAEATEEGLSQFAALNECATAACGDVYSVSGFQACFYAECEQYVIGCDNLVTLGSGGCSDLLACASQCGGNDLECISACWDGVDYEAHQLALNMLACPDENCAPFHTPGTASFNQCVTDECTTTTQACQLD
jgi:hypothetical protein